MDEAGRRPGDAAAAAMPAGSRHPAATLAATVLGSSMAFIDGSVVNVALPVLARDLGADAAGLSWTVNGYLLPVGALTLLGGAAGDRFGRRRLFLLGLAMFALASLGCALAPALGWLLAGRGLQGLGAALLMPNSLAILGAGFHGEARGKAIGTWAAAGALGGALGPLVGGWLIEAAGWRTIFLVNLPVAAAAGTLAWTRVEESRDRRDGAALDWPGAGVVTAALALLTFALTSAAEAGVVAPMAILAASSGLLLLLLFVRIEHRRGAAALMPLALFSTPTFVGLTLLTFFLYASLGGLVVLLPFLLIRAAGYTAVEAGAAMLPIPIVIGLGSRLMGGVTVRVGGRGVLGAGSLVVAAGLALYLRVDDGRIGYWSAILPGTLGVAVGMSVVVAPLTTMVMTAVDADHVGAASGFNSAVARIAGLVAAALAGFVFARAGDLRALVEGFRAAVALGAGSALAAAACAFLLIRSPPERPAPRRTGG